MRAESPGEDWLNPSGGQEKEVGWLSFGAISFLSVLASLFAGEGPKGTNFSYATPSQFTFNLSVGKHWACSMQLLYV